MKKINEKEEFVFILSVNPLQHCSYTKKISNYTTASTFI